MPPIDPKPDHHIATIPAWAAATAIGRAYARGRLRRNLTKKLRAEGYQLDGVICVHFVNIDGHAAALVHFAKRDELAAAYTDGTATR